jgi:SAM-dependent methyltransferase
MPSAGPHGRYLGLVQYYETLLERFGDSHLSVAWPVEADAIVRHHVMLSVVREPLTGPGPLRLLDFGCGAGHLLDTISSSDHAEVEYIGLDISRRFIELCRSKYPDRRFFCVNPFDVDAMAAVPACDYVVMNGVLTVRDEMTYDEMWDFARGLVEVAYGKAKTGLAFNVMSTHVDWERDDLFHVPFDEMARFVRSRLSRHYRFRADYGLHEYTCFVYREPDTTP